MGKCQQPRQRSADLAAGSRHWVSQASCAILHDPEVRGYYDQLRARGTKHNAALCQVANRLVGVLHGCLNARTRYDRNTAWAHRHTAAA